ncbi:hypothetical protein Ciccas_010031, partial [Cichlidogyrus casuarinus]
MNHYLKHNTTHSVIRALSRLAFRQQTCLHIKEHSFCTHTPHEIELNTLLKRHEQYQIESSTLPQFLHVEPTGVFVQNEVNLAKILVYGFDYDYTLASYTEHLDELIFDNARTFLVERLNYPEALYHLRLNPKFAVRGLHYDIKRALLMKLDAFKNIQLDTVYHGLSQVAKDTVRELYQGDHIPKAALHSSARREIIQLMDFFVIPEINLLSNIIEYFERHGVKYEASFVYNDVSTAVRSLHKSGFLHSEIMKNPEKYIKPNQNLRALLERLVNNKRQLFVITNSPAKFMYDPNHGMNFLVGKDWKEFFEVIIVNSNKPGFFQESSRIFREINEADVYTNFEEVKALLPGHMYSGGCLNQLNALKKWPSRSLLYFGDHVYSDLADATNIQGWMTGAIVPELEREINAINSETLQKQLHKLRLLEALIGDTQ